MGGVGLGPLSGPWESSGVTPALGDWGAGRGGQGQGPRVPNQTCVGHFKTPLNCPAPKICSQLLDNAEDRPRGLVPLPGASAAYTFSLAGLKSAGKMSPSGTLGPPESTLPLLSGARRRLAFCRHHGGGDPRKSGLGRLCPARSSTGTL